MPGGGATSATEPAHNLLAVLHRGYLLHQAAGHDGQAALWRWRSDGRLTLIDLTTDETDRMAELMAKYKDRPMDLADASLIVAAEAWGPNKSLRSTVIPVSIV